MEKLNLAGVALAMLAMTACAAEAPPAPEDVERSVVVDQLDDTSLDVTVSSAGDSLRLVVLEVEPRVVDVTFDFGDPMIAFRLDYARGVGDFMPSGAALDARHLRLVDQLGAALTDLLPEDAEARALVEDVALRQTSFMQIVPLGEALSDYQFQNAQGWVHISTSCGRKYIGAGYYRTAGKGCGCTGGSGHGCKGRCGQGCGITSSPRCSGSTAYTQDCARHDYGLASWATASDDYAFASNNASCGGTGTCY
ncbi:MAG: hypothetical protein H6709_11145 [Kofleriaceae bacterium]|nr:hypothetical protein [Kofleriaceae bacterium]MCB9572630.1 hypothetical protein [Kofleriaceae bacterium]